VDAGLPTHGDRQIAQTPGLIPSTRVTTTVEPAPASSAARPVASCDRTFGLVVQRFDLSSRRCTPPINSSVVEPTRRAASATAFIALQQSYRVLARDCLDTAQVGPIDDSLTT
jgi:hypothetical protein